MKIYLPRIISLILVLVGIFLSISNINFEKIQPNWQHFSGSQRPVLLTASTDRTSQFFALKVEIEIDSSSQTKNIELLSVDTDNRRQVLVLRPDGYFAIGNIGGKVFQKSPLDKGFHQIQINYEPTNGLLVTADKEVVLASSIALDILQVVSANSVTVDPKISPEVNYIDGSFASSNHLPTKSLSKYSIFGLILLMLGIVLAWQQFISLRLGPVNNPIFKKMFIITASICGTLMAFGLVLELLGYSSMSYVSTAIKRSDWFDSIVSSFANPYANSTVAYPPFAYGFYSLIPKEFSSISLGIFSALSLGTLIGISASLMRISNKFYGYIPGVVVSLGFPTYFAIDRGNIDLIVISIMMIVLLMFILNYEKLGTVLGGLITALKLFPLPFILLLQRAKSKGSFFNFILLAVTIFLASIWALLFMKVPVVDWLSTFSASSNLALNPPQNFSKSALSLGSAIVEISSNFDIEGFDSQRTFSTYKIFTHGITPLIFICVVGLTFIWAYFDNGKTWVKVSIFTLIIFLFSPITFIYRGMLLLICLALLSRDKTSKYKPWLFGLLFGLLLSPIEPIITTFSGTLNFSTAIYVALEIVLLISLIWFRIIDRTSSSTNPF